MTDNTIAKNKNDELMTNRRKPNTTLKLLIQQFEPLDFLNRGELRLF